MSRYTLLIVFVLYVLYLKNLHTQRERVTYFEILFYWVGVILRIETSL